METKKFDLEVENHDGSFEYFDSYKSEELATQDAIAHSEQHGNDLGIATWKIYENEILIKKLEINEDGSGIVYDEYGVIIESIPA